MKIERSNRTNRTNVRIERRSNERSNRTKNERSNRTNRTKIERSEWALTRGNASYVRNVRLRSGIGTSLRSGVPTSREERRTNVDGEGKRMPTKKWAGRAVTNARNYWRPRVDAGIKCSKCGMPILKGQRWHVDHLVPRELGGLSLGLQNTWPAHASCNESDGGKRGAEITNAKKRAKKMNTNNTNNTEPLNAQTKRDMGIRGV